MNDLKKWINDDIDTIGDWEFKVWHDITYSNGFNIGGMESILQITVNSKERYVTFELNETIKEDRKNRDLNIKIIKDFIENNLPYLVFNDIEYNKNLWSEIVILRFNIKW